MLFVCFQGKTKAFSQQLVDLVVTNFYFDLVPPFYFPKWNRDFSAFEHLPNSSCHFRKRKPVFLQILHQSSVPSNITLLYFCTFVPNYGFKCDPRNLVSFHPTSQKSENFFSMGSFGPKYICLSYKNTEELYFVTLNSDTKFKLTLTLCFQKWHEKLGELSLEHSKAWKIVLWWTLFVQSMCFDQKIS